MFHMKVTYHCVSGDIEYCKIYHHGMQYRGHMTLRFAINSKVYALEFQESNEELFTHYF